MPLLSWVISWPWRLRVMWWLKFSNLLLWAPTSPFTKRLFNWEFVSPVDKCFPAVWICTILGQPVAFPASPGRVIFSLCPGLGELGRLGGISELACPLLLSAWNPKHSMLMFKSLCLLPRRCRAQRKSWRCSKDGIVLSHENTNKHSYTLAVFRLSCSK